MVRIIKNKLADKHTNQTRFLLDLLALYIADEPDRVARLLNEFGYTLSKNLTGKELTNKVFLAIEKQGRPFHLALARLLSTKIKPTPANEADQEDGFDLGPLLSGAAGAGTSSGTSAGGGITVGADPVSAIAGAVGSIANLFGNKQRQKILKDQARSQTLQTMLAYKAQKEAETASRQAAQVSRAKQEQLIKLVGGIAVVGVVGWLLLRQLAKQKRSTKPTPTKAINKTSNKKA